MAERTVVLVAIHCPDCRARVHTIALASGPQLVRHDRRFTDGEGRGVRCRRDWVAVPASEGSAAVRLVAVASSAEIDATLRREVGAWLAGSLLTNEPTNESPVTSGRAA